jgi:hypothetical protein
MKIGALFGASEEYVYSFTEDGMEVTEIEPSPEVPPPCWGQRPISGDACRAATKALCG